MNRWLRWIYPSAFSRRYGDEIAELLERSPQPVRDHLDVVVHAGYTRWEHEMKHLARHIANIVLIAAIFVLGYAVNDLAHGVGELPRHWWSTAALLLVVLAAASRMIAGVIDRRREIPARSSPI